MALDLAGIRTCELHGNAADACSACRRNERNRYWRQRNPKRVRAFRDSENARRHGLTPESYTLMLDEQGGRCAICGNVPKDDDRFQFDHAHGCCENQFSCGRCVRSLLCSGCNTGLGHFGENPQRLRAAADYAERWSWR